MDERKKNIKELEDRKRETEKAVTVILEQLGENVLVRMLERGLPHLPETADYCRLQQDITESEAYISAIERNILRMKALQDAVAAKEQERTRQVRQLRERYIQLGGTLLEHPECNARYGLYKRQIALLVPKIRSLENRLERLGDADETNVFSWIGKNAQSMVIRSLLESSQESLRQMYESLGEQYMRSKGAGASADITGPIETIRELQTNSAALAEELKDLKYSLRKIGDIFGPDGNPYKRIEDMEKHIALIKGELRRLYLRVGQQAAAPAETEGFAGAVRSEEDAPLLTEIEAIQRAQANIETRIENIEASIRIDEEKLAIEKLRRTVKQHQRRIAASKQAISELETRIAQSQERIADLTQRITGAP
jgi:chromosome segregation ATPase